MITGIRRHRNDPLRIGLYTHLIHQQGEWDTGPFRTTGQPVRFLDILRDPDTTGITVGVALQEVNPAHRGQALDLRHGQYQGTIHHAEDRQGVLLRIDIRQVALLVVHVEMQV